jgi:hypothetical protein
MADMRSIPGTPSWIESGAKTTQTEQPATQPQPQPAVENTQNTQTAE